MNDRIKGSRSATEIDVHVGAMIRTLRELKGMTLQQLAAELQLSHQQLQKYECGINRISAGMLYEVARVFDANITIFFPDAKEDILTSQAMRDLLRAIHSMSAMALTKGEVEVDQ